MKSSEKIWLEKSCRGEKMKKMKCIFVYIEDQEGKDDLRIESVAIQFTTSYRNGLQIIWLCIYIGDEWKEHIVRILHRKGAVEKIGG